MVMRVAAEISQRISVDRKRRGLGTEPWECSSIQSSDAQSWRNIRITWGNLVVLPYLGPSPDELNQNHWPSLTFQSFLGDSNRGWEDEDPAKETEEWSEKYEKMPGDQWKEGSRKKE